MPQRLKNGEYSYAIALRTVASCVGTVCGAYGDGNFIDIPSGNLNATTTTYVHTDALHSTIAETNASGVVTRRFRYESWGAPTNGSYEQGPGYTGHVTDAATGLSYMQQRYYDPIGGRFLSVDPVAANPASFNRYWHANNNPYKNIDPDGRQSAADRSADQFKRDAQAENLKVYDSFEKPAMLVTVGMALGPFAAPMYERLLVHAGLNYGRMTLAGRQPQVWRE